MNIEKLIVTLILFTCVCMPINGMTIKKIGKQYCIIKLSYKNKLLSLRQTVAFTSSKMLQDMIFDEVNEYDGKEIAIDEIIDNKDQQEYFKNNILDIINIVPSKLYIALKAWSSENKKMLWDEISTVTKNEQKKIMDMIKCAQYIDSPVRNDLIEYALENNKIDQEIIEYPDFTSVSLKNVKQNYTYNAEILDRILPLKTINELIDRQISSEKNIIFDVIKTMYYEKKAKHEAGLLMLNQNNLDNDIRPTDRIILDFRELSLPSKIKLIQQFSSKIQAIDDKLDQKSAAAEEFMISLLYALDIPCLMLPVALALALSSSERLCLMISMYYLVTRYTAIIFYICERATPDDDDFLQHIRLFYLSPFIQMYKFYKAVKINLNTRDDKYKKFLADIKQSLENIIKNEYV